MTLPEGAIFNRRSEITVGPATLSPLGTVSNDAIQLTNVDEPAQMRVQFKCVRSLKPEPNTADLRIFNLTPDNRKKLEETEDLFASISAGYIDNTFSIFSGALRTASTFRDGQSLITQVDSGDGEKEYRTARVNQSFTTGATTATVIKSLAEAMELGEGNIAEFLIPGSLALGDTGGTYRTGTALSGLASDELTRFCESVGLERSIQDGNLLFLKNGTALDATVLARTLSPTTGLIDVPSVDNDGVLKARTYMLTDLTPGRVVNVEAEFVEGRYRIEKATYQGDTRGNDWFIDIEGKRL